MAPLDYLVLRLARRVTPRRLMRSILRRGRLVKPGLETLAPQRAADRFCAALSAAGVVLEDARVLIFGYGGRIGVGVELVRRGAGHVVLLDPYAEPSPADQELARRHGIPIRVEDGRTEPGDERITLVHGPVEGYAAERPRRADIVFSNSVLEHVEDMNGAVASLARLTAADGRHFHIVDLRDHFFKHPFEMLCHGEAVWNRFLNPPTHLNRLRIRDYVRQFERRFEEVSFKVIEAELERFRVIRPRIRPEFLTGDERIDAATRIELQARRPRATDGQRAGP